MGKIVRALAIIAITIVIAVYAPELLPAWLGKVGTLIAVAVITAAAVAGFNAVFPPPKAKAAEQAYQMTRASVGVFNLLYGQRRASGQIVFYHPKQVGSIYYRYFAICVTGHRCAGLVSWMLKDEIVTVDGSGLVTSGAYANHAWLWFARGEDDEVANATLVAECDGKWTTDHRGRGAAMIYAKFEMTDEIVQAGMPTITGIIQGKDDILDPRDGSEGYTNNATLVSYDWLRLPREEGGFGTDADEIPDDDLLSAWANICDEDVDDGDGGTEKRYALDSVIQVGGAPSELRQTFVTCQAGTWANIGGVFWLRPGYWVPPSHSLEERDLAGPITIPMLEDPQKIATQVNGTFVDPANNYQPMPVPTWSTAGDIVQMDVDLPHITSSARSERIIAIMGKRAQCEKKVSWPMNIAGLAVQAMDTVQLATARYGLSNYAFVVDSWGIGSDYGVGLQLREENEDIYADLDSYGSVPAAPALAVATPIDETAGLQIQIGDTSDALADLQARIDAYDGTGPIP